MKDVLWAIALLAMLFAVFGAFGWWLGRRPATGPRWGRGPGRVASLAAEPAGRPTGRARQAGSAGEGPEGRGAEAEGAAEGAAAEESGEGRLRAG